MTRVAGQEHVTVGIGAGAAGLSGHERGGTSGLATQDMVLNIGPQHPATHGVLRLRLTLDGERIVDCEPIVGYMHRGVEKLFEVRDYRQIIVLANRHDWLSAFSSELGVVLAVERMLGMEVPERATWTRTLLAELNRVLNHLMFLGSYPIELGAITPIFYAFRERETIQAVMEEVSGGRMHYMFNRVGGLKEDLPAGWLDRVADAVTAVGNRLSQIEDLIFGNEIFQARTRGVGGRLRPAPRRALPRLRRAAGRRVAAGRGPRGRRLLLPVRPAAGPGEGVPGRGRGVRRPAALPGAGTGERPAAQDPQGARGGDVLLDGEPARHQRLLPGLARGEDPLADEAAQRVVQQHRGAARGAGGLPGRGHGGDPRLHVLRGGGHRQVSADRLDRRGPGPTSRGPVGSGRAVD
jgi:hypothetical protein